MNGEKVKWKQWGREGIEHKGGGLGRKKNVHICNVNDKTVRDERKLENP